MKLFRTLPSCRIGSSGLSEWGAARDQGAQRCGFAFRLRVLEGRIIGYTNAVNIAPKVGASASGLGLRASDPGVLRCNELGFVFAPFITILLIAFSAHRSVLNGDFKPFGLMGTFGLVAPVLHYTPSTEESL